MLYMKVNLILGANGQQLIMFFTLQSLVQKHISKKGGRFYCVFIDYKKLLIVLIMIVYGMRLKGKALVVFFFKSLEVFVQ